jgi:hypothetical protein
MYQMKKTIPQSARPSIAAFEELAKNANNRNALREFKHRLESLKKRNKTWAIILTLLASGAAIGGMLYAKSKGYNLPAKLVDSAKSAKSAWIRSKQGSDSLPNGVYGPLTKKQYNRESKGLGYEGSDRTAYKHHMAFKEKKRHAALVKKRNNPNNVPRGGGPIPNIPNPFIIGGSYLGLGPTPTTGSALRKLELKRRSSRKFGRYGNGN